MVTLRWHFILLWLRWALFSSPVVSIPSVGEYIAPEVQQSAAYRHTLTLRYDGAVIASGRNDFGQIGDGSQTNRLQPVEVFFNSIQASAGEWHSLFLRKDGVVYSAGRNDFGQLGEGSRMMRPFPRFVMKNAAAVLGGGYHSLFLMKGANGTVQATGDNTYGQLGDGTNVPRNVPRPVLIDRVTSMAAGSHHSVFLRSDGTAWVTGRNNRGQLGDGTTTDTATPKRVMSNVQAVSAKNDYSLFVLSNGAMIAAGNFNSGLPRSNTDWSLTQYFTKDQVQQISTAST